MTTGKTENTKGPGIDRSVILENSKQILIDEKARFPSKNGFSYPDILLEHISNDQTNAPGWTCKPLRADYICYAITGLGQAYLATSTAIATGMESELC